MKTFGLQEQVKTVFSPEEFSQLMEYPAFSRRFRRLADPCDSKSLVVYGLVLLKRIGDHASDLVTLLADSASEEILPV